MTTTGINGNIGDPFVNFKDFQHALGIAYYSLGDFRKAIEYHERHLEISREVGDRAGERKAYCNLGNAYDSLGDFQKAIEYHERDLKISKEMGDRAGEGRAYCNLGNAYDSLGYFQKAIEYHERHLKISKEVGDRAGEGKAYGDLGNACRSLGDFQKAIEYHERHLKISEEVGHRAGEGRAYGNLGNACHSLGDFQKAIEYHERRLKISKEVGDRAGEGGACGNLGNAYHSLGDFQKAIEYHERHLKISKEVGDRAGEGKAYGNLGNAYDSLGDFQKAIEYHERRLKISKEVGDRAGEGRAYGNLGITYDSLGDFQKAIEYHERDLKISKEVGDRAGEGRAYCNLGNAYHSLGDFQRAIEYHERDLKISKEVGDRAGEGIAYGNLGNAYDSLGDFRKAIEYHERHLKISKEVGDRAGEGKAYGNLGNAYHSLGDFRKAIEYHERHLKISKEVGDRAGEGRAYGNLGNAYHSLGDFQKAIEYHERDLKISKEVGDRAGEGRAYGNLGNAYHSLGDFQKAVQCYENSVTAFDHIRRNLISNDEWKITLKSTYDNIHLRLWELQFKEGKVIEALLTADQGRAGALNDLLESKYGLKGLRPEIGTLSARPSDFASYLPPNTAFMGISEGGIVLWVNEKGKEIKTRRTVIDMSVTTYFQSLLEATHKEIGVKADVNCEDRSLSNPSDKKLAEKRSSKPKSHPSYFETNSLQTFYNVVIDPIRDLLQGDEVVIVPQGPLCLAPYSAFMDLKSKYLCETFRIRLLPSLSSLELIQNCPADWHSKTGALLVGDPWVQEVVYEGEPLDQLIWAKREVQMIGEILQAVPLVGMQATKDEVLRRISSVALVHIAAHGKMETGEIALAPNTTRSSVNPGREDYLLTMKDVLDAQIRARLVVLSCCHSAWGEVKSEGVVGISRAFLGAGARAVLVSLWAIDDKATMEFMKVFYQELVHGRSASEALNKAMKSMRASDDFSAVRYWAPFVLIGDDVTLEFEGIN
ncbi:unnamed protein product [Porites evermanni]|uniref:CHAT domain-containing protein n=1 Tax=Porites evermanni TaxID=104178 RepID=A0ABN8S8I5_9CNID|nr:unnamed protein product [Porites evermanni]